MDGRNEEDTSNEFTENSVVCPTNSELLPDFTDVFHTMELFESREVLIDWVRERAFPLGMVVVVGCSDIGNERRLPRLVLICERGGQFCEHKKKIQRQICDVVEENLEEAEDVKKRENFDRRTGTKKCDCPFRLKSLYSDDTCLWSLEVVCGYHNHALAQYLEGHAYAGRLSFEEESLVASMSSTHARPKQILASLQKSFPHNKSTIKTIYNIRHKHRYVEHAGRSQMQYLLGKLEEFGYYHYTRRCQQTDTVKDMFYAHPASVQLLRAFPNVLLMDCTYKTNRYRLPLFEIVGVTSTNMTFSIACAYLESEKEDNYTWALTVLKGLMDQKNLPTVIVTDREIALMSAIQTTFPTSRSFLCRWHINKNIAANCKKKFRTKDQWNSFLSAWNMILLANTEDRYTELLKRFQDDYSTNPFVVKYVVNNWIQSYKERFVNYWTNNVMHLDNTTTCRAEGAHAKLKKFLGSNMGNLETCWEKMHDLLETSINAIKASFERSVNVVQHRYKSPIFQFIRGMVSIAALDKVLDEMKTVGEYGVDPLLCGCVLRTTCGLPCAHEIDEHVRKNEPISLDSIAKFWRKMDMEPLEGGEVDIGCDIESRWTEAMSEVNAKFTNADESAKLLMLKRFREIVNPSTTSLIEPSLQIKTRGRPKGAKSKQATSTKREPSAFEYADSVNDSCEPVKGAFVFDIHLTSDVMFSTTKAKQKVVRRKIEGSYIDQIPSVYRSFVVKIEDVKADGYCGFRAIAGLYFGNEDSWGRVRGDIHYELGKHIELWKRCFLEIGRWQVMYDAINCFEESAPPKNWLVLPDMGHLIASAYNIILVTLGGRYPATFLPFTSAPPSNPQCFCIALVRQGNSKSLNHFIRVTLGVDHPFPSITLQWRSLHSDSAVGWEEHVKNILV